MPLAAGALVGALTKLNAAGVAKSLAGPARNLLLGKISQYTGIDLLANPQDEEKAAERLLADRGAFRDFKLELEKLAHAVEMAHIEADKLLSEQRHAGYMAELQSDDRRVRLTRPNLARACTALVGIEVIMFPITLTAEMTFQWYWFSQCMTGESPEKCFAYLDSRDSFLAMYARIMSTTAMLALNAGLLTPTSFYFFRRTTEKLANKDDSDADGGNILTRTMKKMLPEKRPQAAAPQGFMPDVSAHDDSEVVYGEEVLPAKRPAGAQKRDPYRRPVPSPLGDANNIKPIAASWNRNSSLTLADDAKNPGALNRGRWTERYGAVDEYTYKGNTTAIFDDRANGIAALCELIMDKYDTYTAKKNQPITVEEYICGGDIIPASRSYSGGQTHYSSSYLAAMKQKGVDPAELITGSVEQMKRLVNAHTYAEGGKFDNSNQEFAQAFKLLQERSPNIKSTELETA